jgi:hypothetical protein
VGGIEPYDDIGTGYSLGRRTDPRWMTVIRDALGTARTIAHSPLRAGARACLILVISCSSRKESVRGVPRAAVVRQR